MTLHPDTIKVFKDWMINPQKHGYLITPIEEFFLQHGETTELSEMVKPYLFHTNNAFPKSVVYIVLSELYGPPMKDSKNGKAGYKLKSCI